MHARFVAITKDDTLARLTIILNSVCIPNQLLVVQAASRVLGGTAVHVSQSAALYRIDLRRNNATITVVKRQAFHQCFVYSTTIAHGFLQCTARLRASRWTYFHGSHHHDSTTNTITISQSVSLCGGFVSTTVTVHDSQGDYIRCRLF
jgi:hypothetical protein